MNTRMSRLCLLGMGLVLCFGVLLGRLIYIQVYLHDELESRANRLTERTYIREAYRGSILDRNGEVLASSEPVHILCADPSRIGRYHRTLGRALARYLGKDEEEMIERLRPRYIGGGSPGERRIDPHQRLGVTMTDEEWTRLRSRLRGLVVAGEESLPEEEREFIDAMRREAIFSESVESIRRTYHNGELAAHVLGYVQTREKMIKNRPVFYLRGQTGVEARFDRKMQGVLGWRRTETSRDSREMVPFRSMEVEPRKGLDLHLTLDIGVQRIVEEELRRGVAMWKPEGATVIVLRPRTGEILAMANHPTFDPARYGEYSEAERRNRAISDQYEPGSTFKTISVAAALGERVVDLDTRFDCEGGEIEYMGVPLTDDHEYGILTVRDIIKKSSNIGTFKIARILGEEKLHHALRQFGIGQTTGIALPAAASGRFRSVGDWSGISITRVPIGYEVAVTPLQITMALAALANDGWLMRPLIVASLVDEDGVEVERYAPERIRQVVSARVAREITRAMERVVESGGTAIRARLDHHDVAGKTGTSRKYIAGKGYSDLHYFASFIGYFPARNPEVLISVIFDEPRGSIYGGVVAGLVFREIGQKLSSYLDIPPSKRIRIYTRQLPAGQVAAE